MQGLFPKGGRDNRIEENAQRFLVPLLVLNRLFCLIEGIGTKSLFEYPGISIF